MNFSKKILHLVNWKAGPGFFYIMSAACILLGAAMITIPLYESTDLLTKRFYLVGTIHFYEIALIFVTLLICRWKKGNDDAISLVCLLGIFMIGSTITLDTVSVEFPLVTLGIGIAGFIIAVLKIHQLTTKALSGVHQNLFIAIILLLLPNFLMPGILGLALESKMQDQGLITIWLLAFLLIIGAGGFLIFHASSLTKDNFIRQSKSFLHNPFMNWIFVFIIFVGAFCHQFTLNISFALQMKIGDFLPLVCIGMLIALEFMRIYGKKLRPDDVIWMLLPVSCALAVVKTESFTLAKYSFLGMISQPTVCLILTSIGLFWHFFRNRNVYVKNIGIITLIFAFFVLDNSFNFQYLLWAATVTIFIYSIYYRNHRCAIVTSLLLALVVVTNSNIVAATRDYRHISISIHVFFLVFGLSNLFVYIFFKEKLKNTFAFINAVFFMIGIANCFLSTRLPNFYMPLTTSFLSIGFGFGLHLLIREWATTLVFFYPIITQSKPLLQKLKDILPENKGWIVIIISFLLLGLGVLSSFAKVTEGKDEDNENTNKDIDKDDKIKNSSENIIDEKLKASSKNTPDKKVLEESKDF